MTEPTYVLVRIDAPHALAGKLYWQATEGDGPDARLIGLFDDDGDQVNDCSRWTALRDDLVPPFV